MSLLILWLLDMSTSDRVMLKSSTIVVDSSISSYNNTSFCLMCFDVLSLNTYTLRTSMSSWRIDPLIIMELKLDISFSPGWVVSDKSPVGYTLIK